MARDRDGATTFDWQGAYRRLERVRAAIDDQATPTQIKQRLKERAASLARPLADNRQLQLVDLVGFRLGELRYAIAARQAAAIVSVPQLTPLPGLSHLHLGVIGHRGTIYALVDIRPIIGATTAARLEPNYALLLANDGHALAVAADAVDGFMRLDAASIAPIDVDGAEHAVIQGISRESIVILDADRLVADARLVVDREPLARGHERQGEKS